MRLRKSYIIEDTVLDASGTVTKDLDFKDPIAGIYISVQGKKYDHANINPLIARNISKVEIVDGTKELFSMNMEMAQALFLNAMKTLPLNVISANAYATNQSHLPILFGREFSDKEWAFDPTKYTNPQLKITYAFTEGAGYWTDNYQKMTIYAILQEQVSGRPANFLSAREFYSWTKTTSGDQDMDMPIDYPIRMLLWSIKDCTSPVYNELNKIKIDCNMGEWIPIEQTCEDLAWENAEYTGLLHQQTEAIGDGSETDVKAYYPFAWNWGADADCWNSGQACVVKRPYSGYITVGRPVTGASSGTDFTMTYLADGQRALITGRGYEFNSTEHLRFGDIKDAEEFFDPTKWKSCKLIFTQGGSDALTTKVAAQVLRPNGK